MDFSASPQTLEVLARKRRYLVTGAAGFIGSNILEALLDTDNEVVGLDDLSSGRRENLEQVQRSAGPAWRKFKFIEGDIRNLDVCHAACKNVDVVLHLAARGSVPSSIGAPLISNEVNVGGSLNMMVAARDAGVERFVFSSSCSVYGDQPDEVKVESKVGRQLSPYAVSKYAVELYARNFADVYNLHTVILRYFNVFGPRQLLSGPDAAVIPIWIASMIQNKPCLINGSGTTSRDFCYVDDVVQANVLASSPETAGAKGEAFNVCMGQSTSLTALFDILRSKLAPHFPHLENYAPEYGEGRTGDITHSRGSLEKAAALLGFQPSHSLEQGLDKALPWFIESLSEKRSLPLDRVPIT